MTILTIINCTTAKEFLDKLTPWNSPYTLNNYVFRGHTDDSFKLHPNIMRTKNDPTLIKLAKMKVLEGKYTKVLNEVGPTNFKEHHATIEMMILRKFYRSANENGLYVPNSELMSSKMEIDGYIPFSTAMKSCGHTQWLNKDSKEIAALAQHYGLPTRLIDWSYNQYVASFFASNFSKKPSNSKKIAVWMLNYKVLSDLFSSPLSDVKIFSPHYQWNENAKSQRGLFTYIESKHDSKEIDILKAFYNDCKENGIISVDPKYKSIYTDYRTLDVALGNAIDKYNKKKIKKIDKKDVLIKITLPCNEAMKVNDHLRAIRISESTIFPGYNGVVDDMRSVLRFQNLS
jgi:hypothetical protein